MQRVSEHSDDNKTSSHYGQISSFHFGNFFWGKFTRFVALVEELILPKRIMKNLDNWLLGQLQL